MRTALSLATDAGQGREVAVLYNNLGVAIWMFEGPKAGLHELRTGLAFARSCGLTESLDFATSSTLDLLAGCGEFDEVLVVAKDIAERLESSADLADLLELRASQMGVRAMRGQSVAVDDLDWLERVARGSGDAHVLMQGLCSPSRLVPRWGLEMPRWVCFRRWKRPRAPGRTSTSRSPSRP